MHEVRMKQTVTKVNVLSPVMYNVVEADVLNHHGRQYLHHHYRQDGDGSTGILGNGMFQDGKYVNSGDPSGSQIFEYAGTSRQGQELANDLMEVGLIDSTRSVGKPRTWGSDQQLRDNSNSCCSNTWRLGL